jgi:hypothetical protein
MEYKNLIQKITVLTIFLVFTGVGLATKRDSDEIFIYNPFDGQNINNQIIIMWKMHDADQVKVPLQIDLFKLSCPNNGDYYGLITDNIDSASKTSISDEYTLKWNTGINLKNDKEVLDGKYCMRVCGTFVRDGNYYYSLCDTRSINVENTNKVPQIISRPEKLTYKIGDTFSYQINASDLDNDKLTYKLVDTPDFININQSTGLIKSNGSLDIAGNFTIKYLVDDSKGGIAEDLFTINVSKDGVDSKLFISAPVEKQVVKTSTFTIKWSTSDSVTVVNYVIYYSKDAKTWAKINNVPSSVNQLEWNIDSIKGGDYYIKIDAELSSGDTISAVSGQFAIDKSGGTLPLIKNVQPVEDSVISNRKPVLTAEYYSADGSSIPPEQVVMSLDEVVVENCEKTDNTVVCKRDTDLKIGKHTAKLIVMDVNRKSNQKEWSFEVTASTNTGDDENTSSSGLSAVTIENLKQVGIIVGLGALFIIVPWFGFLFIRKMMRNRSSDPNVQNINVQVDPNSIAPSYQTQDQFDPNTYVIGNNDYSEYGNVQPIAQQPLQAPYQAPTITIDNGGAQMPSSYTDDEIPDWLKDIDAIKPVNQGGHDLNVEMTGGAVDNTKGTADDIAMPHDS